MWSGWIVGLPKDSTARWPISSRGRDRRADPKLVFPKAQSILSVAVPYWRQPLGGPDEKGPRYARYLKSSDYHESIADRLEKLMHEVSSLWKDSKLEWKVCVDTSAILERSWAALAGLGWIGKNTTLIHPKYGSYLFLRRSSFERTSPSRPKANPQLLRSLHQMPRRLPHPSVHRTGHTRLETLHQLLDPRKRGDLALSSSDSKKVGTWIAGCDTAKKFVRLIRNLHERFCLTTEKKMRHSSPIG